jgi:endonuclease YncB( thermonuclease family)
MELRDNIIKMKNLFYIICVFLSLTTNSAKADSLEYFKVKEVLKGDVLVVNDRKGVPYYFYLAGIECPELNQEGGVRAKEFTKSLVLGKMVLADVLRKEDTQIYGLIQTSYTATSDVGVSLMKAGLAWADTEDEIAPSSKRSLYRILADTARLNRKGLWENGNFLQFEASRPSKFQDLKRDQLDQQRVNGAENPTYQSFGKKRSSSRRAPTW